MATHASSQVFAPGKVIGSFHPPKRILMGPGPSEIHPRVLAASSAPSMGYLDPVFVGMMDEIKQLIRYAYQTKTSSPFPYPDLARSVWNRALSIWLSQVTLSL